MTDKRLAIWVLNDGATHHVFASSKADAMAVVAEHFGDENLTQEWAKWGPPSIDMLTEREAEAVMIHNDEGLDPVPLARIFTEDCRRSYVACSEW